MLAGAIERIGQSIAKAIPGWTSFNANQQAALVSFSYNVGPNWFDADGFRTISRAILEGRLQDVPAALRLYVNPGSPVEAGLRRRRHEEGILFATPVPVTTATPPRPPAQAPADGPPAWPAGMVGPKIRPPIKPGDHHLIANDINETLTAYSHDGKQLWRIPCLCRGQGREAEWNTTGSDTPPGLYRVGKVYRDYEDDPTERFTPDRRAYGWYSFDLEGLEGQEGPNSKPYRDGIMMHGGGSACGWPGAWSPRQELHPTLGCIRLHNQDLRDRILPLLGLGTVYVSVLQEAA
ncbi:MAG: L,D-transpeptidase family protein [Cyanobacteria bacterium REEB417]|nr:L,D-transpeptidase family protein [Cyanobacteria bacterium REEB417]